MEALILLSNSRLPESERPEAKVFFRIAAEIAEELRERLSERGIDVELL